MGRGDDFIQQNACFPDVAEALLRILREAARDELPDGRRCSRRQLREIRIALDDFREDFRDVLALERALASQHLNQDDAEGPDIGAPIDHLAPRLFRRHVGSGAEDESQLGRPRRERR